MKTLAKMRPGERRVIQQLKPSSVSIKLLEMGLLPGKTVRFNFSAPFGDPISVQVAGYQLSLRLDEADLIEVA
ncbi:FeoA family protein [Tunicatimonas pelagia]|uniref:FeoA family protein n=1 Tax=Tunicatimonas pelagia TaxID=931531 RepID=UPI002666DA15|nr:FeoA family protein [Tunicatimonas pelagia]WKN42499.1 FeoA family protein [Tunicatimonas pelagia]